MIFRGASGTFHRWKSTFLDFLGPPKKIFFCQPPKSFIIWIWGHIKNFMPKKWFLGVLLAHFIKIMQRGDHWNILKKKYFFEFFSTPPKILHDTHMRSDKKIRAKKTIFRGAFGLFSQKYPKRGPLENFEKKIFFGIFFLPT